MQKEVHARDCYSSYIHIPKPQTMSFTKEYDQGHNYAETLLQKIKPPRKRFFFNSKTQSHFIQA